MTLKTIDSIKIAPARRHTAKQAVIDSLQKYIVAKALKPGDALPTEYDLAAQLGVSRNILREGLQYFKTLGIVESKPRRGAVIKRLSPKNLFKGYIPYLGGDRRRHREIEEARMVVELGVVPLLVKQANASQIRELSKLAGQLTTDDPVKRVELEIEFHTLLLSIPNNEILLSLKSLIVDFFEKNRGDSSRTFSRQRRERIARQHTDIVEALKNGKESELAQAIQGHYLTT